MPSNAAKALTLRRRQQLQPPFSAIHRDAAVEIAFPAASPASALPDDLRSS
jgi:hypothetical protein